MRDRIDRLGCTYNVHDLIVPDRYYRARPPRGVWNIRDIGKNYSYEDA